MAGRVTGLSVMLSGSRWKRGIDRICQTSHKTPGGCGARSTNQAEAEFCALLSDFDVEVKLDFDMINQEPNRLYDDIGDACVGHLLNYILYPRFAPWNARCLGGRLESERVFRVLAGHGDCAGDLLVCRDTGWPVRRGLELRVPCTPGPAAASVLQTIQRQ